MDCMYYKSNVHTYISVDFMGPEKPRKKTVQTSFHFGNLLESSTFRPMIIDDNPSEAYPN